MTRHSAALETFRRMFIRQRRAAIRAGARLYASDPRVRAGALRRNNVLSAYIQDSDPLRLAYFKGAARAMKQMQMRGHWGYSEARYIAIMQCLYGEMILARQSIETPIAAE